MKIIAGLGNPGSEYENTRHNAGFMVVEAVARKYGIGLKKKAYGGLYGFGKVSGRETMLFEPHTFMNLSGEAVKAVCASHMEEKEDLLVVSDDVALPLGVIRLREKGSSGGHNGLASVIGCIGQDFARLRIGVGAQEPVTDMKDYVLGAFRKEERPVLKEVIEKAVLCVEQWLEFGASKAMAAHNG